jgi:hypothetical protein
VEFPPCANHFQTRTDGFPLYPHRPPITLGQSHDIAMENHHVYNFFSIYTIPSGYDSHSHGKIHPFLKGKPSISMPWLNHGYVSHSQRVLLMNHFPKLCWIKLLINGYTTNMNVIPPKFTVKSLFLMPLKSTSSGEPPWGSWVAGSPVQE